MLLVEFLISFASTVGFGIITNIPRRALLSAGITGSIAWSGYIIWNLYDENTFISNLIAAIIIGLLGNYFAVKIRVPVNMIYIPSLVSLVPGGTIYLALKNFSLGHLQAAQTGVLTTLTIAVALAVGFVLSELVVRNLKRVLSNRA